MQVPSGPHLNHGVNLGDLYARANTPTSQHSSRGVLYPDSSSANEGSQVTHAALVKLRGPELVSDETIDGVAQTLSQLAKLGMVSIVIVGLASEGNIGGSPLLEPARAQVNRIVDAIQASADIRAQNVEQVVQVRAKEGPAQANPPADLRNESRIVNRNLLYGPLARGVIPVLGPIGLNSFPSDRYVNIGANDTILALVRELTGIQAHQDLALGDTKVRKVAEGQDHSVSLDRIIVLDPLGGIPSTDRDHGTHVYINIEQEYMSIKAHLKDTPLRTLDETAVHSHIQNLTLLKDGLALLPPTSSGFIATPEEVANSASQAPEHSTGPRVRTRRQRNPLIHNLLTDKPAISSSLPDGRALAPGYGGAISTFVKRGMPVAVIPDPSEDPWTASSTSNSALSLSDPRIDLTRLVALIEASFQRKLDVNHYLSRIRNRLAGLIVAGEYEGCALFTWESPPQSPHMMVPYLDKFAVLPQSQGTGASVADILFKSMVNDCFPKGVCWRSRVENPVNKWYFERARGTWQLPGTRWTSFWTTKDPSRDDLLAYEGICKAIQPSWVNQMPQTFFHGETRAK